MQFTNAKQVQVESVPAQPSKEKNFLFEREAGVWLYLRQSLTVMAFVFMGGMIIGWVSSQGELTPDWSLMTSIATLVAWISGFAYFIFSLWRWNLLSWLETKTGMNLDSDPRIGNGKGKRPTMVVKVVLPDGSVRVNDTELPKARAKRCMRAVAAATLADRPNSQKAMSGEMSRPDHEKTMLAYTKLGVLRKEDPSVSNSRYVVAEPVKVNTVVLRMIANGEYEMANEVWASKG